jgi:hypothetical protein
MSDIRLYLDGQTNYLEPTEFAGIEMAGACLLGA